MSLIIQHLRQLVPDLPPCYEPGTKDWAFDRLLKAMPLNFYSKLLSYVPLLTVEYSVLCTQIRQDLLDSKEVKKEHIVARLTSALILCELLEHLHRYYLNVPREVVRLRKQQELFRALLNSLDNSTFNNTLKVQQPTEIGLSLSQYIRELTAQGNWYRIGTGRSARVLNLLSELLGNTSHLNHLVRSMEVYSVPFLAYLGLSFHIPRLLTNSFLLLKHTIPGFWLGHEEFSLAWTDRLYAQWQRRWFELGNDLVWTLVPVVNLFLLVGPLATSAVYLSTLAFAFDAVNAILRAYIELQRLYGLKKEYRTLFAKEDNEEDKEILANHLTFIQKRIDFEQNRLGLHVTGNVLIFAAMTLAMPVVNVSTTVLLASAVFNLLLWAVSFALNRRLEKQRPNETIGVPVSIAELSFFATTRKIPDVKRQSLLSHEVVSASNPPPLFV